MLKESQCLKCDGKGRNISFRPNSDTSNLLILNFIAY